MPMVTNHPYGCWWTHYVVVLMELCKDLFLTEQRDNLINPRSAPHRRRKPVWSTVKCADRRGPPHSQKNIAMTSHWNVSIFQEFRWNSVPQAGLASAARCCSTEALEHELPMTSSLGVMNASLNPFLCRCNIFPLYARAFAIPTNGQSVAKVSCLIHAHFFISKNNVR